MVSRAMSRTVAAKGRAAGFEEGSKGWRWRQRRTGLETVGSKSFVQRDWSSMMMRRVVRFRRP